SARLQPTQLVAGNIDNTATAAIYHTAQTTASAHVPISLHDALPIYKQVVGVDTAGNGILDHAGETIDYDLVVTNTGNETLTGVTVVDPLTGTNVNVGTLLVGATSTVHSHYSITQQDIDSKATLEPNNVVAGKIDNTATADRDKTAPTSDSAQVPIVQNPHMSITKSASIEGGGHADQAGDIIDYTVTLTNDGNVTLHDVVVTDVFGPGVAGFQSTNTLTSTINPTVYDPNHDGILEVGETWTLTYNHVVTSADLTSGGGDGDGKLDNTATAESFDPHFGPISASAEIPILLGPGVRTPGFWSQNTGQNQWTKFWDGIVGNEPKGQ